MNWAKPLLPKVRLPSLAFDIPQFLALSISLVRRLHMHGTLGMDFEGEGQAGLPCNKVTKGGVVKCDIRGSGAPKSEVSRAPNSQRTHPNPCTRPVDNHPTLFSLGWESKVHAPLIVWGGGHALGLGFNGGPGRVKIASGGLENGPSAPPPCFWLFFAFFEPSIPK